MKRKVTLAISLFIFLISTNFLSAQSCSVNAGVGFETATKVETQLSGATPSNIQLGSVYWETDAAFPSSIVFEDIQSPVSKVTFLLPGTYTLFLKAKCKDGFTVMDKIKVTVTQ